MRCEICGAPTSYDFSTTFDAFGLGVVDYWRCGACGFVLSRTHAEMSDEDWRRMNAAAHGTYQGQETNPFDPRWKTRMAAQGRALAALARGGLIAPSGRWLDYGCGDGGLSDLMAAKHGLNLGKYDAYMATGDGYLTERELMPGRFDLVITTSVFEHLTRRMEWDAIEALVAPNGAFGLHTLVAERVPDDPAWFYLQPPHSAFFSNAAMDRLFRDWGYRSSVYSVVASLWVWFRGDPDTVSHKVEGLNADAAEPFLFKEGFLDYWKTDPRQRAPTVG